MSDSSRSRRTASRMQRSIGATGRPSRSSGVGSRFVRSTMIRSDTAHLPPPGDEHVDCVGKLAAS